MRTEVIDDFSILTAGIHEYLVELLPSAFVPIAEMILVALCFLILFAVLGLVLVYVERKICAFFQNRLGPTRVGPYGTLQTLADVIKLLLKEPLITKNADKFLFNLAPFFMIIGAMMTIVAVPFAKGLLALDLDIGVFYIIAVSSIGVIGILLAGWSSNNKYSLIGAMRSGAQIVSYELSVGLSILTVVVFSGSLNLLEIVENQKDMWFIFSGHFPIWIAFIIYLIAGTAETNRGPFDLAEAESELTAGFHTEYSGMKFAFFFLAEFINMFIIASIAATLFFGGWQPLHLGSSEFVQGFNGVMNYIPSIVWFLGKVSIIIFLMMWFRWTFPRLRIDQLLTLEWKYLLPINLVNILIMAFIVLMGWHL